MFPGVWHEETLDSIRAITQGEEMPAVGYDSDDDPQVLVNKRVEVGVYNTSIALGCCTF